MKRIQKNLLKSACALSVLTLSLNALASEGFRTHYSPGGTLTGETTISQEDRPGYFASVFFTSLNVDQINGADGNGTGANAVITSGVLSTTPVPALGGASTSQVFNALTGTTNILLNQSVAQAQTQANILAGYVTQDSYLGGKLIAAVNIPVATISRTVTASLDSTQYSQMSSTAAGRAVLAGLVTAGNSLAAAKSGTAGGLGDIEITGAWSKYNGTNMKYIAGVTVVAPTGAFDANAPVNVGFGYYTIRPSVAAIYHENTWSFGGRATYGYNTTNNNTSYQSGNFAAFELSGAYKLPNVSLGLNLTQFIQVTDDTFSGATQSITTVASPGGLAAQAGTSSPIDGGQRTKYLTLTPFVAIPIRESGSLITMSYTMMPSASDSQHLASLLTFRWTQVFK
ncbi:MAG: transporter [Betaproteobacteria bacterium]